MARKPKTDYLDFSKRRPSWAEKLREQETKATERVDAAIKAGFEEGAIESITEQDRQKMIRDLRDTGDFDFATPAVQEEQPAPAVATAPEEKGLIAKLAEYAPYTARMVGQFGTAAELAKESTKANFYGGQGAAAFTALQDRELGPSTLRASPTSERATEYGIPRELPTEELVAQRRESLEEKLSVASQKSKLAQEQADKANAILGQRNPLAIAARAVGSIAGQPEQILPVIGGLAGGALGSTAGPGPGTVAGSIVGSAIGSVPMAKTAYNSAFQEAMTQFDATPEEAEAYAYAMTAIEFGTDVVGGGLVSAAVKKLGMSKLSKEAAQAGLARVITSRTSRTLGAAGAEGATELASEAGGDVLRAGMESLEVLSTQAARDKLIEYNAKQAATRFDRYLDSTVAGVLTGGVIATPAAHLAKAAELGRQEAETTSRVQEEFNRARDKGMDTFVKRTQEAERTRAFEEVERQRAAEVATAKAEAEQAAAAEAAALAEQKSAEEEAAFRTMEAEQAYGTPTRVEEYAGVLERTPVNPPNLEVTPEQVAEERAAAKKAETERKAKVEQARQAKLLRESERSPYLPKGPLPAQPAATAARVEPSEAPPAAAPKAAPQKPAVAPPTKSDKALTDTDISDLTAKLGLGMKADKAVPKPEAFDEADFQKKSVEVVKGLVKKNKQETADVQNLLRQGKLVLAPNPESLGRSSSGNAAEYDPEENRMFLYTDRIDPKDTTATVMGALHESTHAGQFNDREGRPSILKQMMSPDRENKASATIRTAADKGNKIARAAVDAAIAVSPDTSIQDLELVPYFVSEAAKAKSLGQMGGVANTILTSARTFVREKLGRDLDITLDDIAAASTRTAGEIVSTDMSEAREGATLAMIAGPTAKSFKRKQSQGRTYTGAVDQGERFEIPDNKATITNDEKTIKDLLQRKSVPLDEVLNHEELYAEYPQLKDYKVMLDFDMPLSTDASYYKGTIALNPNVLLQGTDEKVRTRILHELQHAIQELEGFVPGANSASFIPDDVEEARAKAAEAYEKAIKAFDLGRGIKTLPPEVQRAWSNEVRAMQNPTLEQQARLFVEEGYFRDSKDRIIERYGENTAKLRSEKLQADRAYDIASREAFQTYLRDYGETEARNTEFRADMSPAELEASSPESTMQFAEGGIPVERTIDTTPFVGGKRKPPQAATLGMAKTAAKEAKLPLSRQLPAWVSGLFTSSQGTGKVVNELIEFARSSPVSDRMIAEGTFGKYKRSLNALAAERGMTPDELTAEIGKKLDALDVKEDSYEKNRAAFAAIAKQYGATGQALLDLRDQVDALSLDMLKQRAASGVPLTEQEKATYKTVLHNLGRYSHRQYAIHMQKAGKDFADTIWDDYQAFKKKGGEASPKVKANYERVAGAVKKIVDDNLFIPDDAGLVEMSADRVRSLYSQWGSVGNPEGLSLDSMRTELASVRDSINGDKNRLTKAAEDITQEILGLNPPTGPISRYYRGQKMDTSILKSRQKVPEEIRNLMGEIKDPAMRLFSTAAKQAEFVARNKMLLELTKPDLAPAHIQPPSATGTQAVDGMQKLEGDSWGPLEGYYVSPNMRNLVGDTIQQLATFEQAVAMAAGKPSILSETAVKEVLGVWGKVAATTKMLQIIGKPINFLYNFLGGPILMLRNGNINPVTLGKALSTATNLITYAIDPTTAPANAIRVNKYGVTDSAFVGEIKAEQYKELADVIKKMQGENPSKIWSALREAGVSWKELYAMMDVTYKIANFYQQADTVLPAYYKAAGIEKTQEQIDREAADIVNRTNITYKRAAPLIKAMERGGLTNFGTYFWEVFRTEITNVQQGVDELRRAKTAPTPKAAAIMLAQGASRLTGQAAAWTAVTAASRMASQALFGDDEEEGALRALLPDFMRTQDFVKVGFDDKGDAVLWDFSRLDPQGPVTDIMRSALHGDPDDVMKKMMDLYIAPRIGSRLMQALLVTAGAGPNRIREPLVKQQFPEAFSGVMQAANYIPGMDDRKTKAWTNVAETFLPGIVDSYRDTNVPPLREDLPSSLANAATYLGGSMTKLNPDTAARNAAMDYSGAMKEVRRDIKDMFLDNPGTLSDAQILDRILKQQEKEREAFDQVQKVYDGMLGIGITPRQAAVTFKDNRLPADVISDARNGTFNSRAISKESIDQYKKNEMVGKTMAEKKEVKQKWDDIWEILEEVSRATEEQN